MEYSRKVGGAGEGAGAVAERPEFTLDFGTITLAGDKKEAGEADDMNVAEMLVGSGTSDHITIPLFGQVTISTHLCPSTRIWRLLVAVALLDHGHGSFMELNKRGFKTGVDDVEGNGSGR
jgi:hypothetical protein